jgi:predicted transcriptional regulator
MATQDIAKIVARDFMTTRLVTLFPDMDVFKAIDILVKKKISGAPVVGSDNRLLGTFSEKCCMQVLIDGAYDQLPTSQVHAFMDKDPQVITEETGLLAVAQVFLITPRRRLPVVRDGKLVGQISRRDVIRIAATQVKKSPEHRASTLLYLSALRKMEDVPAV